MGHAGLGVITPDMSMNELLWGVVLYVGFLYLTFSRLTPVPLTNLLVAVSVFSLQFALTVIIPGVAGFQEWLFFGFLIGRVLGVYHPAAPVEAPLGTTRKVLGWLALVIFILCASPAPFVIE
jgi:hypothetical protein